ncbi:MAG: YggS family pyridoxal phosphate-dependent enzyme [Erysipelotrichaceae bacterium]|nr:YggS family pyridoxal phosphate-dependent enzyme [Erysipelotrichaceae bacterium]
MNVDELKQQYPLLKTVVAVSKTHPIERIREVHALGFCDFGENKAQELKEKAGRIDGVAWHFIGHLQTNKVKDVVDVASWIHSVDSVKLLKEIEKQSAKINKPVHVLMQINLTGEASKTGLKREEIEGFLNEAMLCKYATLRGIMVIGPTTDDHQRIRETFKEAKSIQVGIQKNIPSFQECSMGMSHDYQIALEEGATMIRIGTLIFGER